MNKIKAILIESKKKDDVNLLIFESRNEIIKVLTLEIDFNIGTAILYFKPTMVSISKKKCESSIENNLKAKIVMIKHGEIFSNIYCDFIGYEIEVLLLNEKVKELNLNIGDEIYLMIRATEIGVGID